MATTTKVAKPTQTKTTEKKAKVAKSLTELNTANLEKVAKSFTEGEVALTKIKYVYPEDCDTKEKRKAFRVKARKEVEKLEKLYTDAINGGDEKAIKKARRALQVWQGEHYLPDYISSMATALAN